MPFGLLGLLAAIVIGRPQLGAALLAIAVLNRVLMAVVAGNSVVGDSYALRLCWLYPLRDLMGFGFWACSFFGNSIVWRGQRYRLEVNGLMVPVLAAPAIVYSERLLKTQVDSTLAAERVL
jgi:ceramide glucosyltransferase